MMTEVCKDNKPNVKARGSRYSPQDLHFFNRLLNQGPVWMIVSSESLDERILMINGLCARGVPACNTTLAASRSKDRINEERFVGIHHVGVPFPRLINSLNLEQGKFCHSTSHDNSMLMLNG